MCGDWGRWVCISICMQLRSVKCWRKNVYDCFLPIFRRHCDAWRTESKKTFLNGFSSQSMNNKSFDFFNLIF